MKRIAFYLSLVLVVLVLASCKKGQKNLFTPTSSGRPYEVLVVVNKPVWDRPAGRAHWYPIHQTMHVLQDGPIQVYLLRPILRKVYRWTWG